MHDKKNSHFEVSASTASESFTSRRRYIARVHAKCTDENTDSKKKVDVQLGPTYPIRDELMKSRQRTPFL